MRRALAQLLRLLVAPGRHALQRAHQSYARAQAQRPPQGHSAARPEHVHVRPGCWLPTASGEPVFVTPDGYPQCTLCERPLPVLTAQRQPLCDDPAECLQHRLYPPSPAHSPGPARSHREARP